MLIWGIKHAPTRNRMTCALELILKRYLSETFGNPKLTKASNLCLRNFKVCLFCRNL